MTYTSRNTLAKIERMKKKKVKKILDNTEEMNDRLHNDPNAGSNTRAQKSGMGELANSHVKKVGSILNSNVADKAIENIDKLSDPDKRRELVKKKIAKMKEEA